MSLFNSMPLLASKIEILKKVDSLKERRYMPDVIVRTFI